MSRYIDKDKLLNRLCGNDISRMEDYYYNAILDEPEADVVEMNDIMIVSMYDGGYLYSMTVNGRLITDNDDSDDDDPYKIWKAFCYPMDRYKALQIMNEYNVSKVIICEDGGIEIFRKQGDKLRKML